MTNSQYSLSMNEKSPMGHKFLIAFCMSYVSLMLFNAIFTNRYIGFNDFFVLGGTFTSPFIFILDDIITEIYGYKVIRFIIFSGFFCQTGFTILSQFVAYAPHPSLFTQEKTYIHIFGISLLWISICGCVAYISANIINSYIIARWKVLVEGRHFWLRSIGSSLFSEALYSFIAILMMEIKSISLNHVFKIVLLSWIIKITFSLLFAWPANILVNYIKMKTGIDVYDLPQAFTPLKFFNSKQGS